MCRRSAEVVLRLSGIPSKLELLPRVRHVEDVAGGTLHVHLDRLVVVRDGSFDPGTLTVLAPEGVAGDAWNNEPGVRVGHHDLAVRVADGVDRVLSSAGGAAVHSTRGLAAFALRSVQVPPDLEPLGCHGVLDGVELVGRALVLDVELFAVLGHVHVVAIGVWSELLAVHDGDAVGLGRDDRDFDPVDVAIGAVPVRVLTEASAIRAPHKEEQGNKDIREIASHESPLFSHLGCRVIGRFAKNLSARLPV